MLKFGKQNIWTKQNQGFKFQGERVHLDHDYVPELLRRQREYSEIKTALKEQNIQFQNPFPARFTTRMRVQQLT